MSDLESSGLSAEGEHSVSCLARIKKDIAAVHKERPHGIYVANDNDDLTLIHALVIGPADTPYERGFFYFILRMPPEYPLQPPKVKLMTTGGSKVRFNPNLYINGKVCLSILGTWEGPAWSPAHTLVSLLISIQSLLSEKPYHNEPGYERERKPGDVANYNEVIQHETLRVAVIGMVDNDYGITMPDSLICAMQSNFLHFYNFYVNLAKSKMSLSYKPMQDPFNNNIGDFQYDKLLKRLEATYARLNL